MKLCHTHFSRRIKRFDPQTLFAGFPLLTVCVVGKNPPEPTLIPRLEAELGPVICECNTSLRSMLNTVETPWWMLLYSHETLDDQLIAALPTFINADMRSMYDGYTLFIHQRDEYSTFSYMTRILNSMTPYDVSAMRPVGSGRYTRILNGWVYFDKDDLKDKPEAVQKD